MTTFETEVRFLKQFLDHQIWGKEATKYKGGEKNKQKCIFFFFFVHKLHEQNFNNRLCTITDCKFKRVACISVSSTHICKTHSRNRFESSVDRMVDAKNNINNINPILFCHVF